MSRSLLLLFAPLAMAMPISAARADEQSADADANAIFIQLDANKDGQLTAEEIPADQKRLFERLMRNSDKNGDGKLSSEEFSAGLQARPAKSVADSAPARPDGRPNPDELFERMDANGDGKVTLDEIPEPRRPMVKQLIERGDKDGDGALTKEEFFAVFPGGLSQRPQQPGKPKRPDRDADPMQLFRRWDKNADGKLALDEIPEPRRDLFEKLLKRGDKDGDKSLSAEEFTAAMQRRRPDQRPPQAKPENRPAIGPGFPPRGGLFAALDTDHDGKLSSGEISAAVEVIRKLDKDGDGDVTVQEMIDATTPPDGK